MPKQNTLIPLKDRIKVLADSYDDLELFIRRRLFGFVKYDEDKAKKLVSEIKQRIEKQDKFNILWIASNIPKAYKESAAIAKKTLDNLKLKPKRSNFSSISEGTIRKSIKTLKPLMDNANAQILARVNSFFRLMKKSYGVLELQNLADWWSDEITAGVNEIKFESLTPRLRMTQDGHSYMAVPSRSEIQKMTSGLFQKTFGNFDFIQVSLKGGGVRNYNPTAYFKMVARTEMRSVQTEAIKDRCQEYDNDLVQVSNHQDPCELCEPFEGQIFSISGESKIYPPLTDAPPFHPNCEHNLDPISPEAIKFEKSQGYKFQEPNWNLSVDSIMAELKEARKAA